ncbi:MAG: (2Fe-2S)-binding protein, partial [Rhodospirillaceae bacterium]|nr:(2Fe-2S)-binding protein [Rhodospirillaceae bacterium]
MPRLNREGRYPVNLELNGQQVSGHAEPRMLLS